MDLNLKEAATRLRNAKNELVFAAMCFDRDDRFKDTVKEIKETIGDIEISIVTIENALGL